jgi:transposase
VTVNLEATGPYHIPLYCALSPLFRVNLYQPRQARETSKKNVRRAKTDKRDCRTLALLHQHVESPTTHYDDPLLLGARELVRLSYTFQDIRTNLTKRWSQEVFLAFPGLDTVVRPDTATARRLLRAAPTPDLLAQMSPSEVACLLRTGGRGVRTTPTEILAAATETLRAPAHEAAAVYALTPIRETVEFLDGQLERIRTELHAYWDQLRHDTVIHTFPSMGWLRALALHAEFGGLRRFHSADAAVAFAGLENYVYQSEGKEVNGGMTKAGSPTIRRVLWELLACPSVVVPVITEQIDRMRARGKHRSKALHAACKKTIRILWAMERDCSPYRRPS